MDLGGKTQAEIEATRRRAPNDLLARLESLVDFLESSTEERCEVWATST